MVELAPTPRDVVLRDGTAQLVRFRRPAGAVAASAPPLLLVPSLINRWYVLDLRAGSSLVAALVGAGIDTFCLDWGVAEDEDRYLSWDEVLARLARAARAVRRLASAPRVSVLGYCMGGTLAAIQAALHPRETAALVNLAGPIDFSRAGLLATMTDARWFDAEAVAAAGNVRPDQMQSGFVALRPTAQLAKWVSLADRGHDPGFREAFEALETWAADNVPFPAAAYVTYIRELYQQNLLVKGRHRVGGARVELGAVDCPVLCVVADRDAICPPACATALNEHVSSREREVLTAPGGHVGAVVGSRASAVLYPAICSWMRSKPCN
jgi:polyhydroxyalkanoate synthase